MTSSHLSLGPPHEYWNAQRLCDYVWNKFADAYHDGDVEEMLTAYFIATHYYAHTLVILPHALEERNDVLVRAALRNLLLLDSVVTSMHVQAPRVIPLAIPVTEAMHDLYVLGLIVSVFEENTGRLPAEAVVERINAMRLLGTLDLDDVTPRLDRLVERGMLVRNDEGYRRTATLFLDLRMAEGIMGSLLGPDLERRFAAAGFERLDHVTARPEAFMEAFVSITGLSEANAALFIDASIDFQDVHRTSQRHWQHRDLIHSGIPRPYQLEAYAIFRGYGYRGVAVEAPTGSGKTMVGLMCIQDWLGSLEPGESLLVLVPTNNYQQQWVRELCYSPLGLHLPPELVFAGSPMDFTDVVRRTGEIPAVVVMTYAGLAQAAHHGDAIGEDAVGVLLQRHGVREVILDEVHKVADDLGSATAKAVRRLVLALERDEIEGLIGFTGTGEAFRERFSALGLRLVHSVPMVDLVAAGFVAPYAEFGLPSAYSSRERAIRDLLDRYKDIVRRFIELAGPTSVIAAFNTVPPAQQRQIGFRLLDLYGGREEARDVLLARLEQWSSATNVGLADLPMITIVQAALGKTDADLVPPEVQDRLRDLLEEAETVRAGLADLMFIPDVVQALHVQGLGTTLDVGRLERAKAETARAKRIREAKLTLATTLAGSYEAMRSWYQYMGEGRVAAIKAVIEAERAVRRVSGIIVFDRGKRIRWEQGLATPGFDGVAGLFAEALGDPSFVPIAALGSEIYIPDIGGGPGDGAGGLPGKVVAYIEHALMNQEVGTAMADLLVAGLGLSEFATKRFEDEWEKALDAYTALVRQGAPPSVRGFAKHVLRPVRRQFGHQRSGVDKEAAGHLRRRLTLRNHNLRGLLTTFFDYQSLADRWRDARVAELQQASGRRHSFRVIRMPMGRRKQLMYDLVSRLVDSPDVTFDMVIVSQWARTGWNVLLPNILIDATATREVTAWQQLRGRAMRALPTWTNDCYHAQAMVLGLDEDDEGWAVGHPPDVLSGFRELDSPIDGADSDGNGRMAKLLSVLRPPEKRKLKESGIFDIGPEERVAAAVRLMQQYNKVTHIYELLKATGGEPQLVFDRAGRRWVRKEAVAHKHQHEFAPAIDALSVVEGPAHAPIIYAGDPRTDSPAEVTLAVRAAIENRDPKIIESWLRAARHG